MAVDIVADIFLVWKKGISAVTRNPSVLQHNHMFALLYHLVVSDQDRVVPI